MTSRPSEQTIYEFGAFRLDPTEHLLVRHGQPVFLTPKTFDLLVYLVEHHGRLIEKRALLSALWPTTVVEEANLAYTVSALRKVLDDGTDDSSVIETVPTKGYRFIVPVTTTVRPPAAASQDRQPLRRSVWVSATALLVILCAGTAWLLRSGRPVVGDTGEGLREPAVRFTPLTVGPPDVRIDSAAISPDGKYLAYANASGIHIKVIDSDETYQISDARGTSVLGWTADSTTIHVVDADRTSWDVALVGGGWQRSGLNLPDGVLSIAPDSSWVLSVNGERELYVTPRQGTGRPVVQLRSHDDVESVTWTPDAQRVYFVRKDGARLETVAVQGGPAAVAFQARSDEMLRFVGPVTTDGRLMVLVSSRLRSTDISLQEIRIDARTGMAIGGPRWLTDWREGYGCWNVCASAGGRRAVFLTKNGQPELYVADFDESRGRMDDPKRLTRSGVESAWAWLPDNRAVILTSRRSGSLGDQTDIVKQDFQTGNAERLVTLDGYISSARVTPDGRWLLFLHSLNLNGSGLHTRIMRAPIEGGVAEEIGATSGGGVLHCSLVATCVLLDPVETVYGVEPVKGKGAVLGTLPSLAGACLSVDGSELYYVADEHGYRNRIQVLSLVGKPAREVAVQDGSDLGSIEALPDGSGWLVVNHDPQSDRDQLLYVTMDGHSRVLWSPAGRYIDWAISSHDGKHLVIAGATLKTGAWLLAPLR